MFVFLVFFGARFVHGATCVYHLGPGTTPEMVMVRSDWVCGEGLGRIKKEKVLKIVYFTAFLFKKCENMQKCVFLEKSECVLPLFCLKI